MTGKKCKGFEEHPCYNRVEREDFSKALRENKKITEWTCDGRHYWQSTIDLEKSRIVKISNDHDCPKWLDTQKRSCAIAPKGEKVQTFKNFDISRLQNPEIVEKIKDFPFSPYKTLLLIGTPGVGKTHLAQALKNQIKSVKAKAAIKLTATELDILFHDMIRFDTTIANEAKSKIKELLEYWYIFIDDLGDERHTEKEVFNLEFKPFIDDYKGRLIVTSNLNHESMMEKYGQKITDRLYQDAMVIAVNAPNYRLSHLPGNDKVNRAYR